MTVILRGISSRASGSGATLSLTNDVPALADGDYMLMALFGGAVQATPPQPPAGWTLIDGETSGASYLQVWGRIAAGEPGSYTISQNTGAKTYAAGLVAFRSDAGKTLYVDAHANQSNASSLNRTCPGVTTTQASAGLACFMNCATNAQSTPPGDMTEQWDELLSTALRVYAMTRILTSAGATGDKVATSGVTATATRCVTVAIAESTAISGTANITLDDVTLAATGAVAIKGQAAITLAPLTLVATGSVPVQAGADIHLDDLTLAATGKVAIKGALAVTLAPLTLNAAGQGPPWTPTEFTATAISGSRIDLSWSDDGPSIDGYSVEQSPNGTTGWAVIGTPTAKDFSVTGLAQNTTYYFRVRARRG